jgi:hypothetical protein
VDGKIAARALHHVRAAIHVANERVDVAIFVSDLFWFETRLYVQRLSPGDDAFDLAEHTK